ncbi:MAG TPA: choice-of-anchor Q domain-containing protein [Solirubrobacterales bacterium]|nr:choice-of-anchor Q domain-containing protein [Solirubrobacterales bacterium]
MGVLVVIVIACAGTAQAATRYAKPTGGKVGSCSSAATGCSLKFAVEGASAGDEVVVEPGTYELSTTEDVEAKADVSVHGEFASPMPVVIERSQLSNFRVSGPGASLQWIEVRSEGAHGIPIICASLASVERVRAVASGESSKGILINGQCEVVDSLALARGKNAEGIEMQTSGTSVEPEIRESTAIGVGTGSIGLTVRVPAGDPGHIYLGLGNTIAAGDFLGLYGEGSSSKTFARNVDVSSLVLEDSATLEDLGGTLTASPHFVAPAEDDYAEAADSPTIDAGASLPGFTAPALDLAGNPRVIGGSMDIGAYEYVPPPAGGDGSSGSSGPPGANGPSGSSGTNGRPPPPVTLRGLTLTPAAFHLAPTGKVKAKARGPVGTKITFSLSSASRVVFTVARKAPGRKSGKGCVRATQANTTKPKCSLYRTVPGSFGFAGTAGADTVRFAGVLGGKALAPGSYRLTATAGPSSAIAPFTVLG